jgi:hypothetical protein
VKDRDKELMAIDQVPGQQASQGSVEERNQETTDDTTNEDDAG